VAVAVAVTVDPPSTGTTEYGTRFCFGWTFSLFWGAKGRASASMIQHKMIEIEKEQKSFIMDHNDGEKKSDE